MNTPMKFYRVRYSCEGGNHGGYSFHNSRREAEHELRAAKLNDPGEYEPAIDYVDEVFVTPTRDGILAALNRLAGHPSNG